MRARDSGDRQYVRPGFFSRLRTAFRERQIYLRSEREIQFVRLRPWVQVVAVLLVMGGVFWLAFATINVTFKDQLLSVKERRMHQTKLDFEDRIANLKAQIDKLNTRLMINQDDYLARVEDVRARYEKLVKRQRQLSEYFGAGANEGGKASRKPDNDKVNNLPTAPSRFASRYKTRSGALGPLKALDRHFSAFETHQSAFVAAVLERSNDELKQTRTILTRLGLNPRKIVKVKPVEADAVGGPFVSYDGEGAKLAGTISQQLAMSARNRILLDRYHRKIRELPLTLPVVGKPRLSSRFGLRRDPFRQTPAMHSGVDFRGDVGRPVVVTAPGRVIRAGWEGAYGRMVEIQHLYGISTRYAHLSKILVKPGQKVYRGTQIGLLGSTGRSTGPHLHYETRIRGRAINPAKFWKARHDLQKLSKR